MLSWFFESLHITGKQARRPSVNFGSLKELVMTRKTLVVMLSALFAGPSLLFVPADAFAQESTFQQRRLTSQLEMPRPQPLREAAVREARLLAARDRSVAAQNASGGAGRRTLIGALVGAGVGFLVMSASADCTVEGGYCALYQLTGAGIGAGVGAAVGFIVGK